MKTVVRLTLVVATLLVVSNVALAQCTNEQEFCYAITATDEYGNTYTDTWWVGLCNEGYGELCSENNGCFDLYLFGGGPGWFNTAGNPMFGGNPFWTTWIANNMYGGEAGYLQPQGTGGLLLTGEGHTYGTRYTVKGMKISLSNCAAID
jgi:hypothetical protein